MATTLHASIQGTLATQLRSPRSPRKVAESAENVKCLECWNPNPKMHPCLFCEKCLHTVLQKNRWHHGKGGHTQHGPHMSKSSSFDSQDSDLTAWEKYRTKSSRLRHQKQDASNMLRTPRTKELIINPSLGFGLDPEQDQNGQQMQQAPELSYTQEAQRKKNAILQQKAQDFEKTATRCGFCLQDGSRRKLVAYCVHCRKHLCHQHTEFHGHLRVFRPHAVVDLKSGTNQGLM